MNFYDKIYTGGNLDQHGAPNVVLGTEWKLPPPAKWKWSTTDAFEICFYVPTGSCWFHRLMQRWLLGIHWRKI